MASSFFELKALPGKGLGCIATQSIRKGTRILEETPLLAISKQFYFGDEVESEFAKLSEEKKIAYMNLASAHGQDKRDWPQSILPSVDKMERRRITEQHAARTGSEKTVRMRKSQQQSYAVNSL